MCFAPTTTNPLPAARLTQAPPVHSEVEKKRAKVRTKRRARGLSSLSTAPPIPRAPVGGLGR